MFNGGPLHAPRPVVYGHGLLEAVVQVEHDQLRLPDAQIDVRLRLQHLHASQPQKEYTISSRTQQPERRTMTSEPRWSAPPAYQLKSGISMSPKLPIPPGRRECTQNPGHHHSLAPSRARVT
jgi:hypothetical protein